MIYREKIIDGHFNYPILIDFLLSLVIWYILSNFPSILPILSSVPNQLNIFPYIICTDVSLAGFILAALTIIVTFKSNLKAKGVEDASNALELIFSTVHYDNIVRVFKKSLIEFTMCFILFFSIWSTSECYSIYSLFKFNIIGIFVTTMALSRSLFILFTVLDLPNHKKEE